MALAMIAAGATAQTSTAQAPDHAQDPKAAATPKVPNYTEAQAAAVIAGYDPKADEATRKAQIESLAVAIGKSTRSVIAKLSRDKVYVKPVHLTKTGELPQKKDATADAIGAVLKLTEADTESLTKANKSALKAVFSAIANSIPMPVETPADAAKKAQHVAYIVDYAGLEAGEGNGFKAMSADTVSAMAWAMGFTEPMPENVQDPVEADTGELTGAQGDAE